MKGPEISHHQNRNQRIVSLKMHSKHQPPPGRKTFCSQHGWHSTSSQWPCSGPQPPPNHPITARTPLAYWLDPINYKFSPPSRAEQSLKMMMAARRVRYPPSCMPGMAIEGIRPEKCFHARWSDPHLLGILVYDLAQKRCEVTVPVLVRR